MRRAIVRFQDVPADLLVGALGPDAGRDVPGARVDLRREGDAVLLTVEAEDTGALRAALNSYLRWVQVALDVREVVPT